MTEETAPEDVPVFKNPSYSVSAASSADVVTAPDSTSGPVGSSFAARARAAELASQNERLGHELKEGEAPPTSGSVSLSGYIKLKRSKSYKLSKSSDSADMKGWRLTKLINTCSSPLIADFK